MALGLPCVYCCAERKICIFASLQARCRRFCCLLQAQTVQAGIRNLLPITSVTDYFSCRAQSVAPVEPLSLFILFIWRRAFIVSCVARCAREPLGIAKWELLQPPLPGMAISHGRLGETAVWSWYAESCAKLMDF